LLHLDERIFANLGSNESEHTAAKDVGFLLQQSGNLRLQLLVLGGVSAELSQGMTCLDQSRQMFVRGPSNCATGDDLNGLLNCLDFLSAKLLTRVKV